MDLTFSEEQNMYREAFRDFLSKECPIEAVAAAESSPTGYAGDIWSKMAGLDWLGLPIPEDEEEAREAMVTTSILAEEMGRVLAPLPYVSTVVLAGCALKAGAREPARSELLEKIRAGRLVVAAALMEGDRFDGLKTSRCRARKQSDRYVLEGSKRFVEWAGIADLLLVTALNGGDVISLLVDPADEGVHLEPLETMGAERFFDVSFKGVSVAAEMVLGDGSWGRSPTVLEPAVDRARVAQSARMVGAASAVLDRTVKYARERVQFSRPIGSFQAIAFPLADIATRLAAARLVVLKAAWLLDRARPAAAREAAMAKALASDLLIEATDTAVHVHGGYGCMLEYDIHHYYRRAKGDAMALGDADYCRSLVCGSGLDRAGGRWGLPHERAEALAAAQTD